MEADFSFQLPPEVEVALRDGAQRLVDADERLIACEVAFGLGELMVFLAREEGRQPDPDGV